MQIRYKNPRSGKSASQSTQDQNDLTEPIWLEGGESISLSADIDKRRLLAKPFRENVVATQVMVNAFGEPTKKVVRVHQPQWSEEGELSIPISWQDTWDDPKEPNPDLIDWRFSRRPDSIWITLTPVGGSSESRANRFVFYDRSFQKGLGVPVTHLRVLDWPAESSKVKVDIQSQFTGDSNSEWIQDQVESLPAPVGVLNLGQRSKPLMKSFELLSAMQDWLVVAEGVKLKASKIKSDQVKDGDVLEIRLTTDSEAFDVTSLKTNLIGTAQDHIVAVDRRFDQQNKIAIHTFQTNRKIDDSRTNITISNLEWEIPKLQSFTCGPLEIEIPIQRNRLPAANTAIRP
jgi:ribosomal 50S subunit-recycling heat shock protein